MCPGRKNNKKHVDDSIIKTPRKKRCQKNEIVEETEVEKIERETQANINVDELEYLS